MKRTSRVVAFLDIGTNSIRLLVVRVNANGSHAVLRQEKETARLGEGEFRRRVLTKGAMDRGVLIVRRFMGVARAFGAREVVAVATSATREARNQGEFLTRLRREAGVTVHVVSGREEARLVYLGVSGGVHLAGGSAAFIDIGGGSTEVAVGGRAEPRLLASVGLGTIRLTTLFLRDGGAGPVPERTWERMKRHATKKLLRVAERVRRAKPKALVGSAGTVVNLTEIARRAFGGEREGGLPVLRYRDLTRVAARLRSLSAAERRDVPGINPERADIIVAGAAILEAAMEAFGRKKILASDRGVQHGLLADDLARHPGYPQFLRLSVRERSVLQLLRQCHLDESHCRRVAALAQSLFDSGLRVGLHDFGDAERELLGHAALLHDVGNFISFRGHHLHSHYLISNAELLGFDQRETVMVAGMARFHRKRVPHVAEACLRGLDRRAREAVVALSTLLRVAEVLERSHTGVVRMAEFAEAAGGEAVLRVVAGPHCELEVWGVRTVAPAFRRVFGRRLRLEVGERAPARRRAQAASER